LLQLAILAFGPSTKYCRLVSRRFVLAETAVGSSFLCSGNTVFGDLNVLNVQWSWLYTQGVLRLLENAERPFDQPDHLVLAR
jgi:hypothetical protein